MRDGRTDGWTDRWVGERMDGWMDGRTDGWVDGRVDGWTDGWMDGTYVFNHFDHMCHKLFITSILFTA